MLCFLLLSLRSFQNPALQAIHSANLKFVEKLLVDLILSFVLFLHPDFQRHKLFRNHNAVFVKTTGPFRSILLVALYLSNGYLLGFTSFCNVSTPPYFPTDLFPRCPLASQLVAIIKSLGQTLDCIRSYNLYCFKVFIDEIAARARLTGRYSSELARCSLDSHPF